MMALETLQHLVDQFPEDGSRPFLVALQRDATRTHTYGDLAQAVRRLAVGLQRRGVGPEDVVGLAAPLGFAWTAVCLGALRVGATVMPLDRQLKGDTLSGILEDSGPAIIFAEAEQAERMRASGGGQITVFRTDGEGEDAENWQALLSDREASLPEVAPDQRAALFYTSGTTGPPKGVPLSHRNLVFQLQAVRRTGLITAGDRVMQPLPLHHVYPFVIGTLAPLALGLTLVHPYALTGPQMLRALREGRVTVLLGVPRLYDALFQGLASRFETPAFSRVLFDRGLGLLAGLQGSPLARWGHRLLGPLRRRVAPDLRIMASGGAPLAPDLAARLAALGWGVAVGYGLTETAPLLTIKMPGDPHHDSVGRAAEGVRLRIDPSALPEDREKRTESGEGEILARGPNVFKGYHNLPEKTEAAFTEDGWFRTGDIGYIDEAGYLRISGRVSTLIVTPGGENIQPDDIESHLERHPAIREAGVLALEDGTLAAVIVPELSEIDTDRGLDPKAAVKAAVAERSRDLPSYKHLNDLAVTRTPLPRTRLGKIRRHLLAEVFESAKVAATSGEDQEAAPLDVSQMAAEDRRLLENSAVRDVWDWLTERYHDRRLGPDTSPGLDLGVDSMEWLHITMEIRQRTGIELEEEVIAEISTVRDLLEAIAGQAEAGRTASRRSPLESPEESLSSEQMRWLDPLPPFKRRLTRSLYHGVQRILLQTFALQVRGDANLPQEGPFIITPNHVSYLDAPALAAALGWRRFLQVFWAGATDIVFRNTLLRYFSRLARAVPIDPAKGVISSMAFAAAVLDRRQGLVWFPEGRISRNGRLQSFKPGVGLLLVHRPVPVIPAYIQGTARILPPGRVVPNRGAIAVAFGKPVEADELIRKGQGKDDPERIATALHEAVAGLESRLGP